MRVVFIGTVEFSFRALKKLLEVDTEVVGVCTKDGSNFNADFVDLTPLCKENDIPFKFIDNINSQENIQWIESLKPDIIFCFGWSSLIKKELLDLTPMGVVGYHPALLPQNRGRHPLIWALALGLEKTGSTFFFMDEGADSGDILSQEIIKVEYEDDARSLYNKMIDIALAQIKNFIPQLKNSDYPKISQDHSISNIWRKRGKRDGQIDFRMDSNTIYNLVRALSKPYVGAHVEYKGEDIIIWKVQELSYDKENIESGKVLESDGKTLVVKTYDGAIVILEHEFKEMPKVGEYI